MNIPAPEAPSSGVFHAAQRSDAVRARYLPRVDALIHDAAREGCGAASPVLDMVAYQLGSGGKRLRAVLPLLVADALGVDPERVLPFAAACEVLHNATLVHDDIQDGDRHRRGQEAAWARFGVPRAINLGDAMLFLAVALAQRVPMSEAARLAASRRVVAAALALVHGQDCELSRRARGAGELPVREDYFGLAAGKTSSLFSLPMAGAAELCGMPSGGVAALEAMAEDLGILFQIQDDILDVHGDKARARAWSDVHEGKRTFLVIGACERLSPCEARRLLALLDVPREEKTEADVAAILALLDEAGALAVARREIERRRERVLAAAPKPLAHLVTSMMSAMLAPVTEARGAVKAA